LNYSEHVALRIKIAAVLAAVKFWMKYKHTITHDLKLSISNNIYHVKLNPKTESEIEVQFDDEVFEVKYENGIFNILSLAKEKKEEFKVKLPKKEEFALEEGEVLIRAQTAGKILKILVNEGDLVRKNNTLLIMEAMKMEIELNSPLTGVIRKIFVKVGDTVKINDPLIVIKQKSR